MANLILGFIVGIAIGYYQPDIVADLATNAIDWIKNI
jgi:multisubunit Na+/H+ antiporter MnhE subunit|tara:strand:+ start:208 stop:318 length:111 start_codon:yes stop_codon:yes gene_type:complete